ncbi:PPP1R18 [Branchiostoma lanceolatum]|uniref:PPP1R18 protein n=1 Tax=Branchiostoma lanceolatum TaxID=7740 RepID=A0A8K0AA10_BRALA|nr:PPP1R18 [Branchiostoma lanceolatum]
MMSLPQWKQVLVEQRQRKAAEERRRQAEHEARLNRMPAWKRDILVRKRQSRSDQKTPVVDSTDHNAVQNEDAGQTRRTGVLEQNGESSLGEGGPDTCRSTDVWTEQGVSEEKIVSVHDNIFVKWQSRNRSPSYDRNDSLAHSGQHKPHSPRGVGIPNNVIIIEKYGGSGYDLQADMGKESVQGLAPTGLERPPAQNVFSFLRDAKPEREVIIIEKDDTEDKSVPCTLSGKVNRLRGKFGDEPRERADVLSATRTKVPETVKSNTRQRKGQKSSLSAAGSMDSLLDVVQQPSQAQKKRTQFHYSSCENLSELDTIPPYVIQKSGSDDSVTVDTSPNIRPRSLSQSKMQETTEPRGKKTEKVKVDSIEPISQQSTRESPKDQMTNYRLHNDTSSKPSLRVKPVSVTRSAPVGENHVQSSGQSHAAKVNKREFKKKISLGNEPGPTRKESGNLLHSKNVPEEGIQIIPTKAKSSAKLTENQNDPVATAIASIKAQSKNTFIVQPRRPAGKNTETKNQHRKEKEPSHHQDSGAKEDDKSPALPPPLQPNKKQDSSSSRKNINVEQKNDASFVIRPLTQLLKENPSEYQSGKARKPTEKQLNSKEHKSSITLPSSSNDTPTTTPVLEPRDGPQSNQHANSTFLQQDSQVPSDNRKTHPGRKKAPAPQPPSVSSVNGQAVQRKPGTQEREELPTTNIDDVEISTKSQDKNSIQSGKTGDQTLTRTMQSSPAGSELSKPASPPSLDVSPIAPPRHKATVRKLTVADYVVIGGYEILSKSSISKGESKKLKISFNDSPTTFEYPSEQSLLEEDDRESVQAPAGLRTTPSLTTAAGDKVSGGLHSYQPSQVTSDVVAGQQRSVASKAPEAGQSTAEGQSHPVEIFAVKPLADSEAPMWSSSSSMALLF